jgi:hypothetical protein
MSSTDQSIRKYLHHINGIIRDISIFDSNQYYAVPSHNISINVHENIYGKVFIVISVLPLIREEYLQKFYVDPNLPKALHV